MNNIKVGDIVKCMPGFYSYGNETGLVGGAGYVEGKVFKVVNISEFSDKPWLTVLWPEGGGNGVYVQAVQPYYLGILTKEELNIIEELNK